MIPTGRTATRLPILERMIRPDSLVYPDGFRRDDALDVSAFHPVRITHAERVGHERTHSNGTENFWNQAPRQRRAKAALLSVPEGVRLAFQRRHPPGPA